MFSSVGSSPKVVREQVKRDGLDGCLQAAVGVTDQAVPLWEQGGSASRRTL